MIQGGRGVQRFLFVTAVLLSGCAVVLSGCGSSETETTAPPGWITFDSGSISLALPDSFEGGEFTDAELLARFDQAAASDPNLALFRTAIQATDAQLLMFGPPDEGGRRPMVLAVRDPFPAPSIEEYVEMTEPDQGPGTKVEIESLTENEARVTVELPGGNGGTTPSTTYWAITWQGSSAFSVFYFADAATYATMDSIFRASAGTIVPAAGCNAH
jgi:hypothetical protein